MSNYYSDHLGTTFYTTDEFHSFRDFGLYPHEHPDIPPAKAKTRYVDIPGADGVVDMTEWPQGYVTFKNRQGTFTFLCPERSKWDATLTAVTSALHGQFADIVKDEEPNFRYRGRLSVDQMDYADARGIITITAEMEPYKFERTTTVADWLWDPFSFETGIIREYGNLTIDGETEVTVWSSPAGGSPMITVSDDMTLEVDGTTYNLTAGDNSLPELQLPRAVEAVTFTFTGTGTASIYFWPGYL